jgi:hypothetical protein
MRSERTRGRFVLVGCGNAKADEPRQARNLYTSNYASLKRRYAEAATQWARTADRRANAWGYLSAEHDVLPSRLEVEPYDTTIEDLQGTPVQREPTHTLPSGEPVETQLDAWALRVRSRLADWLRRPFRADQEQSPCRELVVLAGSDYVDALRERDIFTGRPTALATGRTHPYTTLPPKATVRFPFQEHDFAGNGEQMHWLKERAAELQTAAAPPQTTELSAFDAGYERERARWQVGQPEVDVDGTEQASLDSFEDVPEKYIATDERQVSLVADGGDDP